MDNTPNRVIFHATDPKPNDDGRTTGYLTRIGAGWSHKDGKGASFSTIYGRLVVREIEPREDEEQVEASAPIKDEEPAPAEVHTGQSASFVDPACN